MIRPVTYYLQNLKGNDLAISFSWICYLHVQIKKILQHNFFLCLAIAIAIFHKNKLLIVNYVSGPYHSDPYHSVH